MKLFINSIKALLFLLMFSSASALAADKIYTSYFSNKAVAGYDVIAYFEQAKPVEGSSKYKFSYQGAKWYFSSQNNLDKFKANPEKYAPQYGGYCAWAMANGDLAAGNPPFWNIYNGKLYLNYDQEIYERWLADKDGFIEKADIIWSSMEKE